MMVQVDVRQVCVAVLLASGWVHADGQAGNCLQRPDVRALVSDASARVQAVDDDAAVQLLERAQLTEPCGDLDVARRALHGWVQARALGRVGGDPSLTGPVMREVEALERLRGDRRPGSSVALATDYAAAALRAAVAAAQDERGEMALYLEHARAVGVYLALLGESSPWPVDIDELEGELWFEVDRYADAVQAFERAAGAARGARATVGLARALDRSGETVKACAAYARTREFDLAASARQERDAYLARPECRN